MLYFQLEDFWDLPARDKLQSSGWIRRDDGLFRGFIVDCHYNPRERKASYIDEVEFHFMDTIIFTDRNRNSENWYVYLNKKQEIEDLTFTSITDNINKNKFLFVPYILKGLRAMEEEDEWRKRMNGGRG